ncbi:short chain dehydrogenase [Helicosporidium sp. ATCC 50920]|nr:short chain dehydrogenase [Helicosporidium sp. ATCC 50920]|eukprot:KDD73183.1 short chain dehydrogenase [Helicosporidium sp. ATCC 50920]
MERASARVARLASQVSGQSPPAGTTAEDMVRAEACFRSEEFHQQCYSFDPGRLLLNQVALITGAGQGVGKCTALLFASHGARVVCCDIEGDKAQATADFIRNANGVATALTGDVTDPAFPARAVALAVKEYGGLHILVNNAGFTWDGVIHTMPEAQWQTMLQVHLTAPFRLIQAAATAMRGAAKEELGRTGRAHPRVVLNVSSVSGTHGSAGQTNYAAAKAGVVGLTKALAREWGAFNIRCNALVFGYINTRLVQSKDSGNTIEAGGHVVKLGIPGAKAAAEFAQKSIALGRVGAAEEAAGAMLMLASPYSSYISGQAIEVTGGGWL